MNIEQIYTMICIEIDTGLVVNKYRGRQELTNKHPNIYEWVEWNKTLPEDIDMKSYTLKDGELK